MNIIYPPSPKLKIPAGLLKQYEKTGKWFVQRKFNGQRNVLRKFKNEDWQCFGRHGTGHKNFFLTPEIRKELNSLSIDPAKDYWFDSELLNSKTTTKFYKNRIILFDLLQSGEYLFGRRIEERYDKLREICGYPTQNEANAGIALRITEHIWLAENFAENFLAEFRRFITMPEIEGLVLKLKGSCLNNFGCHPYEADWMIRCRKSHKNYDF